jgi:hypothetical protein
MSHLTSGSGDFNIVFLEMLSKELSHYFAGLDARIAVAVITSSQYLASLLQDALGSFDHGTGGLR